MKLTKQPLDLTKLDGAPPRPAKLADPVHTDLYNELWTRPGYDPEQPSDEVIITEFFYPSMRRICFQQADLLIEDEGLNLDQWGRNNLARAVGAALQRASLVLEQEAQGIYQEPTPIVPRINTSTQLTSQLPSVPFTFDMLLEDWKRERQPRSRTIYESTNMVRKLEAFLGFSDVRRLTTEHLIAWKETLRADGLSPTTIRNGKLAAIRAMLTVAVQNRRLPANPADGVVIAVKREPGDRVRGYYDTEAVAVLTAAKAAKDPVRRWVPLLCAYSGARLGDVCHLRAEDVVEVRGIATMSISPEAGPLKNRTSVRTIPLHLAVIDAGFLEFVRSRSGPLFPELRLDRFGKRSLNGAKVIGRWVRDLGLIDPRLPTSHGWRHRFRTMARVHGMAVDVVDAMLGHTRATVGDGYGEFPAEAMLKELVRLPCILTSSA